jgi:hypothetical protein
MSDSRPPPTPAIRLPPPEPPSRGLAIFWVVSGAVLLIVTLGCIFAVTGGNFADDASILAVLCGSPTLILGAVFLWVGTRRLR